MSKPRKLARWLIRRWTPRKGRVSYGYLNATGTIGDAHPKGPPPGKDLSWLDNLDARPERPSLEG
jgi:hypothetical protein